MQALSPSEATTLGWPAENTGMWHVSCSQQVISLLTGLGIRQILSCITSGLSVDITLQSFQIPATAVESIEVEVTRLKLERCLTAVWGYRYSSIMS